MNSRIQDVACDLSNSKSLGTSVLLCTAGKKNIGEAEHNHQRLRVKQGTGPQSAALNCDRCFCSVDGLNYCNIRGSGAHLSASFAESDARGDGCSPLL